MLVIPCAHMHLPWSPRGCPCPLLEEWPPGDGLWWGIGGYRASTHTLGACEGGLCHTVIQGSRPPAAPPPGDTVAISHLGLPWLRVLWSCCRAGHGGQGAPWVTFAPCFLPTQIYTFFSKQTSTQHARIYFFLPFV